MIQIRPVNLQLLENDLRTIAMVVIYFFIDSS